MRLEAHVDVLHFREAVKENSRAGEKHERERELADHERVAEIVMRAANRARAAPCVEILLRIDAGDLHGGYGAEDQRGKKRSGTSERKNVRIHVEGDG